MIYLANNSDIAQIRSIWEECFTADQNYLNMVFELLFPMVEPYIYKKNGEVLSTLFLIPITFKDNCGTVLNGKYLYAVATPKKARGQKLSIKIVERVSKILKKQGCAFIITRPAEETLFNFYKVQGFTIEMPQGIFKVPQNNTIINEAAPLFNYIAKTYPKRFEWSVEILNYMIQIGEFKPFLHPETTPNNNISPAPFALIKPLTNTPLPTIYTGAFFNFPME